MPMFKNFYRFSAVLAVFACATSAIADQAPNPRSAVAVSAANARSGSGKVVTRGDGTAGTVVSRGGDVSDRSANVSGRSAATTVRTGRNVVQTGNLTNRAAVTSARSAVKASPARSAVAGTKVANPRSAVKAISKSGASRAMTQSRATAVFGDISKIGGGYAQCREAYATCMDQFCAGANDTFRRCYCSDKYTEFSDTEAALDQAKVLLQQFEDNNLNAVDKTAAEVNAMYTATVGEAAIKNDVSGAQSILNEIGDLLSGKKKITTPEPEKKSFDLSSLDFTINVDDIWGSSNSLFDTSSKRSSVDMTKLSGRALFDESSKQCLEIVGDSCTSDAILNMSISAYNIMISQDCNLYEKKIDTQREAVKNTVRQAEKYLREARLEEYRSHNSADVNECIGNVRTALLMDTACGADYKRCMDYTGLYINQTTGEPIYSPLLFKLVEIINLYNGGNTSSDVLSYNKEFDKFLDTKKVFAAKALDSCRDIADTVWTEFKRTALLEIAQAQDEKIEEVKNSCVSTMSECYDTQSGALKDFDKTTAQASGALAANAARAMCADKVAACAALYAPNNKTGCKFNAQGQVENAANCGLSQLLDFVALTDSVKIAEGCAQAVTNYAKEICAPASSEEDKAYPWGCRLLDRAKLEKNLLDRAAVYCNVKPAAGDNRLDNGLTQISTTVRSLVDSISAELQAQLSSECEVADGVWMSAETKEGETTTYCANGGKVVEGMCSGDKGETYEMFDSYTVTLANGAAYVSSPEREEASFYSATKISSNVHKNAAMTYGVCLRNDVKMHCEMQGSLATYNSETKTCEFTDDWYAAKCTLLNGTMIEGSCYLNE